MHRDEQRGGADVVVGGVVGQVRDPHPGADQRRLVAHDVDTLERSRPRGRPGVPYVELQRAGRCHRGAVRRREHQVDADHLVPCLYELATDRRADEAGRTGQQHPHRAGDLVGQLDAVGPGRARAAGRVRERADSRGEEAGQAVEVGAEEREDLLLPHSLAGLGAGVHVGHERERRVALAHLPGQLGLGRAGHVDEVPALGGVVVRLGAGREARTFDDDHRAADTHVGVGLGERLGDDRAVGVGEGQVDRAGLDERPDPSRRCGRPAGPVRRGRRAPRYREGRRRRTAPAPGVRPASAAPTRSPGRGCACGGCSWWGPCRGTKATRRPATSPIDDRRRRIAVRRGDRVLGGIGEERVEAGATDDGDVCLRGVAHPAETSRLSPRRRTSPPWS